MGLRGPLPDPNARRRNKRVTSGYSASSGRPTRPASLTGEAVKEWNRVVPELDAMGILMKADRALLIQYCQTWADWEELDRKLKETGKLVKGARGNLVRNPLWSLRREALIDLMELRRSLVLGPDLRIRHAIEMDADDEADGGTGGNTEPTILDAYRQALA